MATSPLFVVYAPLALAFLFFCLACSLYLIVRGLKTKLYHVIYLSVYFLLTFVYYILAFVTYVQDTSLWWPRIAIYQVAVVTNLLFIQKVFYAGRKSPFKPIMGLVTALAIFNVIMAVIRDVYDGGYEDIVIGRLMLTAGGSAELAIVTWWQAIVAIRAYKNYRGADLEPHVRARYLLFGVSALLLFLFAAIDVPATMIAVVIPYDYYIIETVSIVIILVYSVLNFLTWIMPSRFKRFLNRRYSPKDSGPMLTEDEIMKQLKESTK